ncbi:MAG TPA: hypothetical protein VMX95_04705 [Thermodesulfobacteriota bacterium]|nr:hypothetical protein [Thermodesulfobacteriota bacterium]
MKYDKSLLEVWEWKEKVYQEVRELSAKEYVEKIRNGADRILSDNRIKLVPVSLKKEHRISA